MLRYGSLTYLGTLASFVNYRFDLLLVNAFSGPTQAGLYAVGAGLAEVVWFLPNALTIALAPRVAAGPESEASALSAQATRSVLAVTIVAGLVLAALAPLLITSFFGAAFAPSSIAVWLLLPGIVTFSAWKIMSCYLLGRNLLQEDLLAATAAMLFTLILDLALIPSFGFRGAATASSIAYSIAMFVDLWWSIRRSGLRPRDWLIAMPSDSSPVISRLRALRLRASDVGETDADATRNVRRTPE
jgi:O-antigen/teichoic acid export membrane protein